MNRNLDINLLDYTNKSSDNFSSNWPFKVDKREPWAYMNNVFTPQQCKTIIAIGKNRKLSKAFTGGAQEQLDNDQIRKSNVSWLSTSVENYWIFQTLTDVIVHINEKYYGFDLWGFSEGIQFTEYTAPGGHYKPHVDSFYNGPIRKLSISVQLSDPNDYKGGDLILDNGEPQNLPRDQGTALIFPSFSLHGVTPVTQGTRYSLVAWITGPSFK